MFSKLIKEENPYVLTKENERTMIDGIFVIRPEGIRRTMENSLNDKFGFQYKLKAVFFENANERYLALGDTLDHDKIAGSALLEVRRKSPNFMPTNWGGGALYWNDEKRTWSFSDFPSETMDSRKFPSELGPIFLKLTRKLKKFYQIT